MRTRADKLASIRESVLYSPRNKGINVLVYKSDFLWLLEQAAGPVAADPAMPDMHPSKERNPSSESDSTP